MIACRISFMEFYLAHCYLPTQMGSETIRLKALEVKDINAFGISLRGVDQRFHHLELPMEVDLARIS